MFIHIYIYTRFIPLLLCPNNHQGLYEVSVYVPVHHAFDDNVPVTIHTSDAIIKKTISQQKSSARADAHIHVLGTFHFSKYEGRVIVWNNNTVAHVAIDAVSFRHLC